jgi:hypothetical protein
MKKLFAKNLSILAVLFLAGGLACAQQGLGHSVINSAGPCLDVDGDGYGVGAGCLGSDADDNDATVHSAADVINKYGSMNAFLIHLGYQSSSSPAPVYCIDAAHGNDSTGKANTNADTACGSTPFATWYPGVYPPFYRASVPAIILFRQGTYTQGINPSVAGTSSQSLYFMGYPGEQATIDVSNLTSNGIVFEGLPYVTVTNLRVKGNANGAGIAGGTYILYQTGGQTITAIGDKITYCEVWNSGNDSNIDADNIIDFTVQYNVVHDPAGSEGQHNVYLGSNTAASSGVIISNNILYNDFMGGYPSLQFNGRCNNCRFEGNWIYNSDQIGIAIYNGVSNSYIRNNLVWNTGTATTGNGTSYSLVMAAGTTGQCQIAGEPSICPYNQTGNVIENNTFWSGSRDIANGTINLQGPAIYINESTVAPCGTCGTTYGNKFANNIIVGAGAVSAGPPPAGYPAVVYNAAGANPASYYVGTDTWANNIFNTQDGTAYILGVGTAARGGYSAYNCASFATQALSSTGCSTAAPGFTSVSTSYYNAPASFNFIPQAGSPALGAGTTVGAPATDIMGNPRGNPPSIGAYESAGQTVSTGGVLVSSLSCTPSSLASGATSTCAVTLSQAAGTGGSAVALSSNSTSLTIPASVTVPQNSSSATFTATAGAVSGGQTAVITATLSGSSQTASITLAAATQVNSVTCTPTTLTSGAASTCTLTLNQAGTGAVTVALASNTQMLTVPANVAVAAGTNTTTFSATAGTIAANQTAVVTASLNGASSTASFTLAANSSGSTSSSWQTLSNTMLHSVCPADNFDGISYDFYDMCPNVVDAWSGGIADTKRNRLIIWGGGHSDYWGNEIYALTLGANPTMTRLTSPSAWDYSISYEVNPDGTPTSRHSYNDLVYLPAQDALFSFSGALDSGPTNHTWMFTFADNKWHAMDPVNGVDPNTLEPSFTAAACAYDPNTQTVFCINGNTNYLLQYNPATNTYTELSNNAAYALAATPAIDPVRKLMVFMGNAADGVTFKVNAIDISGGDPTYTVQDWTSQVTGCGGMNANWPGFVYDPAIAKFVGYPNQGGTVYVFDAGTKSCTAQNFTNAPQTSPGNPLYGTFGRFQYFPALDSFALVNDVNQNGHSLTLNSPASSPPASACDLNGDGKVDTTDVQIAIAQVLGATACTNASLTGVGQCTVVSVQRIINASLGGACVVGP